MGKAKKEETPEGLEELHHRQIALMKAMLLYPLHTEFDLGNMVGCSAATVRKWKKNPTFRQEFAKYSAEELQNARTSRKTLDDKILRATGVAVDKAMDFMEADEGRPVPIEIQLDAIKAILAQGHVKAVERSAHLSASVELPPEALSSLLEGMREFDKAFVPSKRFK